MKTKLHFFIALTLLALSTVNSQLSTAFAQGTAFTYQGRLNDGGAPASGIYDLRFTIYDALANGTVIGNSLTNSATVVTNGLFTAQLDFGNIFDGNPRWLEISVQKDGGGFTALSPRQPITPTPYAIFANTANKLASGLLIQQNGYGAPNVIGGSQINYVSSDVVGATIAGGGAANYYGLGAYSNSVTADFGTVSGGRQNTADYEATVSGGEHNIASGFYTTIGGGIFNTNSGTSATIGGGQNNTASGNYTTVGGGYHNTASVPDATVGGGYGNIASFYFATVGGGAGNNASGSAATVGGGNANTASGGAATVGGGEQNTASGQYSFAAGQRAKALHQGAFVWADSQNADFSSTANDQFLIRAQGGVGINTNNPGDAALNVAGKVRLNDNNLYFRSGNDTNHGIGYYDSVANKTFAGVTNIDGPVLFGYDGGALGTERGGVEHIALQWTMNAISVYGTFNNNSDRNAKQDFSPVTSSEILERVAQLPLSEWSYKSDPSTRHVGPMAQDFYSSFNVGTDDKHIAPIDEGGVALAAIQGLNQKLNERDLEVQTLRSRNDMLEKKLNELAAIVKSLAEKK